MKYKYFSIDDVFYHSRGKRLIRLNQVDGDIAYVSSTKFNNGVDNYINPPKYMKIYKNCITIANSGSVGATFYHDYDFVASDHVTVLWLKNRTLTKKIAMYLITLLEKLGDNYFFNREMSDKRISKDYIKLPVDNDDKINWDYIEDFMDKIIPNAKWDDKKLQKRSIDITLPKNCVEIPITQIFNVRSINKRISSKQLVSGDYYYITTSNKNFGFSGFHNEYSENGNVFTVDSATDGKSFYQQEKFIGSDHVEILEIKDKYKNKLNIYTAVYLQTILNYYLDKYEYSRKRAQNRIKKEKLYLPVNKNKEIDWDSMELFIKTLPYSSLL